MSCCLKDRYSRAPLLQQRHTGVEFRMMGHGDPDAAKVQPAKEMLATTLDYYESLLANQKHLANDVRCE